MDDRSSLAEKIGPAREDRDGGFLVLPCRPRARTRDGAAAGHVRPGQVAPAALDQRVT